MFTTNPNISLAGASCSFSGEKFLPALKLAAKLKSDGHAMAYDETRPGEGEGNRTLWVTHYRTCTKCKGESK